MISRQFTHRIDREGITVEVIYEPNWWLSSKDDPFAHLQICNIAPERAPLPVTESGYRSHFPTAEGVAEEGGPVMYVRAWLDRAAMSKTWREQQQKAQQLCMF